MIVHCKGHTVPGSVVDCSQMPPIGKFRLNLRAGGSVDLTIGERLANGMLNTFPVQNVENATLSAYPDLCGFKPATITFFEGENAELTFVPVAS